MGGVKMKKTPCKPLPLCEFELSLSSSVYVVKEKG